ncbi:CHAD domain-containing protein [cf. Phormidesmis sp. LEGE 11477]|uniref:CHAD domain-containing protein n=1 Tax=cf. Phormidesmis sp. LEGE 11477 TaxID=1828680 RepID=UPI00188046E1|nr:CHAD domain-containing protein [cf. Phormidesmis sp. LEGE 11477]MBE9062019.1 CHAD domain-containing protein [cf. Phormidesmis sp. LEGE 11477]
MNDITKQSTSGLMTESQIARDRELIGGYAYQTIRKQSKQVFKLRSPVLSDTDPENLHQMRIATRLLRSALLLFSDTVEIEGTTPIALSRSVAKLTKALGKVRDIDVMQQWFGQLLEAASDRKAKKKVNKREKADAIAAPSHAFSKKEKKVIQSLLKVLKKRRKKQFARMDTALNSATYKRLVKQCKGWTKQPKFSPVAQRPAASSAIRKMIKPLAHLLQHPGWEVATKATDKNAKKAGSSQRYILKPISLGQLNQQLDQHGEQLHDLRKQIKGVRYQAEFFRGLYGIHYAAQIRELRSLQSVLGQIQDQLVVSEFLADELGPKWTDKLPTLYEAFQSSRLDLWKQWQPLQAKYLGLCDHLNVPAETQAGTDMDVTVAWKRLSLNLAAPSRGSERVSTSLRLSS